MNTKFSPRLIAATMVIALGMASTAFAMPPPGDTTGTPGAGIHARHMLHGMKEISRLHDDLKLDAKQDALWKEAEKSGKESMGGMRERFRKQHEEMLILLSQPGADLRAVVRRMDEFRTEGQKLHEANRDRWLAVYDALDSGQKEKARIFFKSKLERAGQRGLGHSQKGQNRGQ